MGRFGHTKRRLRGIGSIGLAMVLASGFLATVNILFVETAQADNCQWDPEAGELVCGGKDPGDPGDSEDPGPGGPPDGTTDTEEMTRVCSEEECPRDIWCDGGPATDMEPLKYYERTIVYYRDQGGWVPAPGEAGQWKFTGLTSCGPPPQDAPTASEVWEAVKRVGLEGAKPSIEPPNGRSLVNLKTNFYTTKTKIEPFSLQVGQVEVQIRATAKSYDWNFGDGSSHTTTTPGDKYPNLEVTHVYEETGKYQPSVTITYAVEWQWGGSGWQALDDLEAESSPPTDLQIFESRAALRDAE